MHSHQTLLVLAGAATLLLAAPAALADDVSPEPTSRRQWCQENPEKCEAARARHEALCQQNPEKCERIKQRRAELRQRCQQDPEKCQEKKEQRMQRRAEMKARCEADPARCEQIKQERRARFWGKLDAGSPPAE
jgi:hypothetical protein